LAEETAAFMADVDAAPKRRTSVSLARNVVSLRARVDREPENWDLLRTYGEALLDDGERDAGMAALEAAMVGYEKADDLISARSVAEEIVRLEPTSIRHQQKRVEYCFRSGDRAGLVDAYVELADALLADGQTDKAKSVYQRVLELAPGEVRAETALQAFGGPEPEVEAPPAAPEKPQRYTGAMQTPLATPVQPPAPKAAPEAADDFIDLGDFLRDDEPVKDTRMVVEEKEPTGDEDADFQDMLRKFKQGVAENVEEEDYDSHYDLGVAFKEMGLLDEAIGEFQKALRGQHHRVRTHEALGQCFIEKGMWPVAATILQKATMEPALDDAQLIGVHYLLGQAFEALGKPADALAAYQRVYAVDIGFRDVAQRVTALSTGRA
jgi:tetratricopeptide (TPR) repeat protein